MINSNSFKIHSVSNRLLQKSTGTYVVIQQAINSRKANSEPPIISQPWPPKAVQLSGWPEGKVCSGWARRRPPGPLENLSAVKRGTDSGLCDTGGRADGETFLSKMWTWTD